MLELKERVSVEDMRKIAKLKPSMARDAGKNWCKHLDLWPVAAASFRAFCRHYRPRILLPALFARVHISRRGNVPEIRCPFVLPAFIVPSSPTRLHIVYTLPPGSVCGVWVFCVVCFAVPKAT